MSLKPFIVALAAGAVATEAAKQEKTAFAQVVLLVPLLVFSLPAGVVADRASKRTVLIATKFLELALMLAACLALAVQPEGGFLSMAVLALLGLQAAFFGPAKYGIIPELVPRERLSAANGLLEMGSNLAILGGMIAGAGVLEYARRSGLPLWTGGLLLAAAGVVLVTA